MCISALHQYFIVPSVLLLVCVNSLAVSGSNQAYRAISTGQLNALLRLHICPIKVVVFNLPLGHLTMAGYLVFRGAWRLDAFSAYPFAT